MDIPHSDAGTTNQLICSVGAEHVLGALLHSCLFLKESWDGNGRHCGSPSPDFSDLFYFLHGVPRRGLCQRGSHERLSAPADTRLEAK